MSARKPSGDNQGPRQEGNSYRLADIVDRLRIEGFKDGHLRKVAFRIEPNGCAQMVRSNLEMLEAPELQRPEFWVPSVYDGENWNEVRCLPNWFEPEGDLKSAVALMFPSSRFDDLALSDDSRRFVIDQLSVLKCLAQGWPAENARAASFAKVGRDFMRQAMLVAHELSGVFPKRSQLSEDEIPRFGDDMARLMELSFRAGILLARARVHSNGVAQLAFDGKPLVDQQITHTGPKLPWTIATEAFLRSHPDVLNAPPRIRNRHVYEHLHSLGMVFKADEDGVGFDLESGTQEEKSKESFAQAIARVAKVLLPKKGN